MDQAKLDLEEDISLVFSEPSYTSDKYILIAAVGEWFCFKFVSQDSYEAMDLLRDLETTVAQAKASTEPVGEGPDFKCYKNISSKNQMEVCYENANDGMSHKGYWLKYILFGTDVARQSFYLIN